MVPQFANNTDRAPPTMALIISVRPPASRHAWVRPTAFCRSARMAVRTLSDTASQPALGDLQPIAAVFGDGGCVKHPPGPIFTLPQAIRTVSFRSRKLGITWRTLSARPVRSAAVRAELHDWSCSEHIKGSRGANAPRELSASGRRRLRRAEWLPSAPRRSAASGPL